MNLDDQNKPGELQASVPVAPVAETPQAPASPIDSLPNMGRADDPPVIVIGDPIMPTPPSPAPEKRGRGRPPGSGKKANLNPAPPGMQDNSYNRPLQPVVDYKAVGNSMVELVENLCVGYMGDDWRTNPQERIMLVDATGNYLKSKNMPDIPPGLMLLLAITIYAAPRISKPTFMQRFKSWLPAKSKLQKSSTV